MAQFKPQITGEYSDVGSNMQAGRQVAVVDSTYDNT